MEGLDDVLSFTPDNEIYGGDVIRSINIANQVLYRKRPTEQAALELTAVVSMITLAIGFLRLNCFSNILMMLFT